MIEIELTSTESVNEVLRKLHNRIKHRKRLMRAIVGTNVVYAAIHQFGGKAGRGQKVDIPARLFLVLTSEDEEDVLQDVIIAL